MKYLFTSLIFVLMFSVQSEAQNIPLKNQTDSVSYAIGVDLATNLQSRGFGKELNPDLLSQGFADVIKNNNHRLTPQQITNVIQNYMKEIAKLQYAAIIEEGKKFLAENAKKPGVVTLPSGLQYKVLKEGSGAKPALTDRVTTHYHGTLIDGTVFDSSVERNEPIAFKVNGVIRGWTEALQLMTVGSKWVLYIPYNLAYGERGAGEDIKPYSTLIFEVELISIGQ